MSKTVGQSLCIVGPVVTGIGEGQVLERIVVDLESALAPGGEAPVLVTVLSKRVAITRCDVFENKAVVNGVLRKIVHLGLPSPFQPTVPISPEDCTADLLDFGLSLVIECPFSACIPVPGACPGDECQVETVCHEAEQELLVDTDGDGAPDLLEEKVCIQLRVKTVRPGQMTIPTG